MAGKFENRRREALGIAAQCSQLLKSRYGAKRVIPFGSVLEEGAWHEASDLDLAVEGLAAEALWRAEKELEAMVPSWLQMDLVPLERAYRLEAERVLTLARGVRDMLARVRAAVAAFSGWLEGQAQRREPGQA